ncbi:MAG TPA: GtrA family protein [Gaiellales bacterium]|nr:GtrA family protein [Gaiellales bacterium]
MDDARTDVVDMRTPSHLQRFHLAVRRPANWLELIRYCVVGGSGYAVNLGVFWLAGHRVPYLVAFVIAFVVAATSNFVLNRGWTFRVMHGKPHHQYVRFVGVSAVALVVDLIVLAVLVERAGAGKLPAAAVAILVATPVSFFGNKLWSFR